jgi:ribonucleoside-diphosphate reductase subunit M2
LLNELGFEDLYNAKNPFYFMTNMSLEGKTNFFERRVTEYKRFDPLDKSKKSREFRLDADV